MTVRQREPRQRNEAFLSWVREWPCAVCERKPSQAAHVRGACERFDKRATGMGEKPDDRWTIPLCAGCHLNDRLALHKIGEEKFFQQFLPDPFALANELWWMFVRERTGLSLPPEPKPARRPRKSRVKYNRKYNWPKRAMPKGRGFSTRGKR